MCRIKNCLYLCVNDLATSFWFCDKVVDPWHVYTVHMCVCVWLVSLNLIYSVRRDALDGGSEPRKAKVVMWPVKHLVINPCDSQVATDCYGSGIWSPEFTLRVSYTRRGTALSQESGVPITRQIARYSKAFVLTQVSDMHVTVCAMCNHIRFTPGSVASVWGWETVACVCVCVCEGVLCAAIKGHDNTLKGAARSSGCQN